MYSGKVELGDLPPSIDIKDESVCCIKLNGLKENEPCHFNLSDEATNPETSDDHETVHSSFSSDNILHTLSGFYATLLVVVTSIAIFSELLHERLALFYIHDYLFLYLLSIGILLLIGAFANKLHEKCFRVNIRDLVKMPQYLSKKLVGEVKKSNIDQCFKVGIYMFGLVVLISNGLEALTIFMSPITCLYLASTTQTILRFIFNGLQIAFFLLNSKEIWNIFGCVRNLAFMHLLATNLTVWIRLLLWESAKDWESAVHVKHNSSRKWHQNELNITLHSLESDINSVDSSKHSPIHTVHYTYNCYWRVKNSDEMDVISVQSCLENSTVGYAWSKTTEFLYPIISQYYFIILCIIYIIWINGDSNHIDNYCFTSPKKSRNESVCSRSTKGLFLGLIILAVCVIISIVFFSVSTDLRFSLRILYCVIFGSSSFSAFMGTIQSCKMKARNFSDTYYNGFLQNSGLLAVYIYGSCNVLAGAISDEEMSFVLIIEAVFMVVHASIQNIFITQISQKKVDQSNYNEKPARQSVMFLFLCNISLWIAECVISWTIVKRDLQLYTFGNIAWPLITRMVYPVLVFYRYHSAVLLYKIWKKSYS
ncbi:proton channel OtopLc isoform X2 [Parasteatoda tepidariorum]|nr:proton channel OtopLc isoform X2 [Parasteatoda tepidariorum]